VTGSAMAAPDRWGMPIDTYMVQVGIRGTAGHDPALARVIVAIGDLGIIEQAPRIGHRRGSGMTWPPSCMSVYLRHSGESRMSDRPFTYDIKSPGFVPSKQDNHIVRRLSAMRGQFADSRAFEVMVAESDTVLYEVYELIRPEAAGELRQGISIVHPGRVGDEYFMTKGHFHVMLDDAEVYYCLHGQGMMVMETPEGEWAVESLHPHRVLYVLPRWAHRLVNTGLRENLVTFFVYAGNAGHDYGSIERRGFRKIVVGRGRLPEVVDNPRWLAPEER